MYDSNYLWRDRAPSTSCSGKRRTGGQGYRAMKMRMGWKIAQRVLKRLHPPFARSEVWARCDIMVDVSGYGMCLESIVMVREMERLGVLWLEDPIPTHDVAGLAEIARALDMPVVVGENVAWKRGHRELFERRATDIAMIDVQAVGGVTEWMKTAAMAEAFNLPVVSHLFDEFSLHLVAAVPNGTWTEHMPWWEAIYQDPPQPSNGWIKVPQTPGIGFELDRAAMAKFRI